MPKPRCLGAYCPYQLSSLSLTCKAFCCEIKYFVLELTFQNYASPNFHAGIFLSDLFCYRTGFSGAAEQRLRGTHWVAPGGARSGNTPKTICQTRNILNGIWGNQREWNMSPAQGLNQNENPSETSRGKNIT